MSTVFSDSSVQFPTLVPNLQAVFTAGVVLPKPVGTCRYWHRSLNPKKLIEVKFSHLSKNMTMQRHIKLYRCGRCTFKSYSEKPINFVKNRLPEETKTKGLRQLKASDIPEACSLLNKVRKMIKLNKMLFHMHVRLQVVVKIYISKFD